MSFYVLKKMNKMQVAGKFVFSSFISPTESLYSGGKNFFFENTDSS